MNRKVTALLGGAAALATLNAAQAAVPTARDPATTMNVHSYAELLNPVPDASALLIADDLARAQQPQGRLQLAEHHHHHHHHHNSFFPGILPGIIGPYAYEPEGCYWTFGPRYWNGWRWVRRRERVCD
jgi:hypothetical protein